MGVYREAMEWANQRGDSGGSMRMRKALMSLYNDWYEFSIGEAISALDARGKKLLFACLAAYANQGEDAELRAVGAEIRASGYIDGWKELLEAAHDAKADLRRRWERERQEGDDGV